MSGRYFIGLDNGGSVTKAGLYDSNGKEIAVSRMMAQSITPRVGYVERDSDELCRANMQCIKEVIHKSKVDPQNIKGVAVTGHGNGLYLVGDDNKPSYNGIISTDTRAHAIVDEWCLTGVAKKVLPIINQNIWAGQMAPLLAWFKRNAKDVLDRTRYAFSCTDYIRYCLTGQAYAEETNISAASLMDLKERDYSDEVLALFDILDYKHLLPPITQSKDICGGITPDVASITGLIPGTPVVGGLVDFAACPLATGVVSKTQLSITTGTWAICVYLSKTPIADENLLMTSIYPAGNYYSIMEGSMTSASNLGWFVQKIMTPEMEKADEDGQNIYRQCDEMVDSIEPEDSPVVFLPFLYGTNVNASAKSCFMGISYPHDKAHMLRAVYEGVVFSTMMHVEKLNRFREDRPGAVRISGGAVKSSVWVQMFADCMQLPIEVSDAKELGTMGVAMCAAVGTGEFESFDEAVSKFVHIKYTCQPNAAKKDIYQKKYELYKKLVQHMDGIWSAWTDN